MKNVFARASPNLDRIRSLLPTLHQLAREGQNGPITTGTRPRSKARPDRDQIRWQAGLGDGASSR